MKDFYHWPSRSADVNLVALRGHDAGSDAVEVCRNMRNLQRSLLFEVFSFMKKDAILSK